MKALRLLASLLILLCLIGCHTAPEQPSLYDEEIVLRVWDALDSHYGSEAFFECEYLPVVNGRIEIIKPYAISGLLAVSHPPSAAKPELFRVVESNPGENEVVIRGTSLHFHQSREGQSLFVAWKRDLPKTWLSPQESIPPGIENPANRFIPAAPDPEHERHEVEK
jgi:hypothetical protein